MYVNEDILSHVLVEEKYFATFKPLADVHFYTMIISTEESTNLHVFTSKIDYVFSIDSIDTKARMFTSYSCTPKIPRSDYFNLAGHLQKSFDETFKLISPNVLIQPPELNTKTIREVIKEFKNKN